MVQRQHHSMHATSARPNELTPKVAIGRALTGRETVRPSAREGARAGGDIGRLIELLDLLVTLADEARSGCSAESLLRLHRIRLLAKHVQWVLASDGIGVSRRCAGGAVADGISKGYRAHSNFGSLPPREQPRRDRPENEAPHMSGVGDAAAGRLL